jgi:predicted lipid-binding transport protein (Tim44 family)
MILSRLMALTLIIVAAFAIAGADVADARIGGGKSFGSRGSRTYSAPPATKTAPNAAPIDRSTTQKSAPTSAQNSSGAANAAQTSRFGGWRGLLMGGLFAAALGSIFGFGALASMLGFVLQFALIAGIVYLVMSYFRNRNQPALAYGQGRSAPDQYRSDTLSRQSYGSNGGMAESASTLKIAQSDLDSFERLLGEIQTAYSREDAEALGSKATPEMLSYFLEQLSENAKQGVHNEVSNVKLLQGDVSEAWREGGTDYATVAIRYALTDVTRDRATGRVISGDADHPAEATELWTFCRDKPASDWQLSAIQQTA